MNTLLSDTLWSSIRGSGVYPDIRALLLVTHNKTLDLDRQTSIQFTFLTGPFSPLQISPVPIVIPSREENGERVMHVAEISEEGNMEGVRIMKEWK